MSFQVVIWLTAGQWMLVGCESQSSSLLPCRKEQLSEVGRGWLWRTCWVTLKSWSLRLWRAAAKMRWRERRWGRSLTEEFLGCNEGEWRNQGIELKRATGERRLTTCACCRRRAPGRASRWPPPVAAPQGAGRLWAGRGWEPRCAAGRPRASPGRWSGRRGGRPAFMAGNSHHDWQTARILRKISFLKTFFLFVFFNWSSNVYRAWRHLAKKTWKVQCVKF